MIELKLVLLPFLAWGFKCFSNEDAHSSVVGLTVLNDPPEKTLSGTARRHTNGTLHTKTQTMGDLHIENTWQSPVDAHISHQ
jgi:hypothetical protein